MLTLVVALVILAVAAALAIGISSFRPRVIRRTTVIDRPVAPPLRRRRVVEDEAVDRLF